MLTKEQIKRNLKLDPFWEPDEDATEAEWTMFEEVYDEVEEEKDSEDGKIAKKPLLDDDEEIKELEEDDVDLDLDDFDLNDDNDY